MRSDIVPGALLPDYELTDHTGKRRKLSELQGPDPMILVLSRGSFCPKDRRQAEGLIQLHREMEVGYCRAARAARRCSRSGISGLLDGELGFRWAGAGALLKSASAGDVIR